MKAVIFDLFGTLVHPFSRMQNERVLTELAAALLLNRDDFARMWGGEDAWTDSVTGVFSTVSANIQHICQAIGVQADRTSLDLAAQIRIDDTRRALEPRTT